MNYEFNEGDYVEDVDGNIGYIDYICDCEECKRRGFNEPHIVYPNYDDDYIYRYQLKNPEKHFKRIGKYDFTKLVKKENSNMKLNETVEMMNSEDYKQRFKAEYGQLVIRYYGLRNMLEKWDNGTLEFEPTCPRSTYNMQIKAMTDYIAVLEARAVMENIDLKDVEV